MNQQPIEQLIASRSLAEHEAADDEISGGWKITLAHLEDSHVEGLSTASAFVLAYKAAYLTCMVVLHASGYRGRGPVASRERATFQAVRHLGIPEISDLAEVAEKYQPLVYTTLHDWRGNDAGPEDVLHVRDTAVRLMDAAAAWLSHSRPHLVLPTMTHPQGAR